MTNKDYWHESITWFCRDFPLSDSEIDSLCTALKTTIDDSRQSAKIIERLLETHLEQWDLGVQLIKESTNNRSRGTLKQRASLLAGKIISYVRLEQQIERSSRTIKALPYAIIEGGPTMIECLDHKALFGKIIPLEDVSKIEPQLRKSWECKCRFRAITKREKNRIDKKG